ncbi:MAG: phage tail protein [Ignavibacteriales bacterium]|nr:phage tail protein [Ignavibacteriales bacterium]
MISIQHNINDAIKEFKRLQQNTIKAEVSANKKIAQQARTEIVKNARARYNIKASDAKDGVEVKHGSSNNPTSRIEFSTKPIPLFQFGARQTKPGASVMIIKGRRAVIRRSFIPTLSSTYENVFVRQSIGGKLVPRLPIRKLYGPSPAKMMFNHNAMTSALAFITSKWENIYLHELEYYNGK